MSVRRRASVTAAPSTSAASAQSRHTRAGGLSTLGSAWKGEGGSTGLAVNQVFLTATLVYILLPSLMVVLSLVLTPRANRITNITVSLLYTVTILASCIGETWVYYLIGSAVEAVLLLAIAHTAWKWPRR